MTIQKRLLWGTAAMLAIAVFAAALAVYRLVFVANPALWTHSDEWIYRAAGMLARLHPARLYSVQLGAPGQLRLPFTYPPFAALVFAAFSGLGFGAWQIGLVAADVVLLPIIGFTSLRIAGHRGRTAAAGAVILAAVSLWLEPVFSTMYLGQINLILLLLVLVDLALPESSPLKGVGIGIAGGIKLTPLIFVPYLYATGRVRAATTSLGTFTLTVVLGFATLPGASRHYWTGGFAAGPGGEENLVNQSINGVLQRLLHHQPSLATAVWAVLALVIGAVGVATAAVAARRGLTLLGVVTCGVTGLLISPISWTHHWVWVIPALALVAAGQKNVPADRAGAAASRTRRLAFRAVGPAILLAIFAAWPRRVRVGGKTTALPWGLLRLAPHGEGLEYTWRGATLVLGNLYVIVGLIFILGAGSYLVTTNRRRAKTEAPVQKQPTTSPLRSDKVPTDQ